MRYSLSIIIIFFFVAGCKNKKAVPADVIPQKKMQGVLYDMMRADQFLSDFVLNKDSSLKRKEESIKLYQQVLAVHSVTKEKFERSFSFYKSHPALLKTIMDSIAATPEPPVTIAVVKKPVKDSLKAITDSINKTDSIRKLKKLKKFRKANPVQL